MADFWAPYALEKEGVELTSRMRADGTTNHMDRTYQADVRKKSNRLHFDKQIGPDIATFQARVPKEYWRLAEEHPFGNPRTVIWKGMLVSLSSLEFAWALWRLSPWLKDARRVVEIGGGYGGFARLLLATYPEIELTIVDLPPMHRIQRYYLENTGIRFGGPDTEGGKVVEGTWDHVYFSPEEVPIYGSFDVAIAMRVLCELTVPTVNQHLRDLDRAMSPGAPIYVVHHFKCINRFEDWDVPEWATTSAVPFPFEAVKNWRERIWVKSAEEYSKKFFQNGAVPRLVAEAEPGEYIPAARKTTAQLRAEEDPEPEIEVIEPDLGDI